MSAVQACVCSIFFKKKLLIWEKKLTGKKKDQQISLPCFFVRAAVFNDNNFSSSLVPFWHEKTLL